VEIDGGNVSEKPGIPLNVMVEDGVNDSYKYTVSDAANVAT
jgi:hypothetical protein